jgi:hypothetical protein
VPRFSGHDVPGRWAWAPKAVATCGVAPLSRRSLELLLRNTWVGVLGDSVARLLCAALLRAVGDTGAAQPVLDGHRSFQYPLAAPGGRVDFVWAPYAENVTAALHGWRQQGQVPDVLILGVSLWHMLHVHDVSAYAASLAGVRAELDLIAGEGRNARVAMFWMSTTALITPKLLTDEKRARLTTDQIDAYNTAAGTALSLPAGPPCQLLDVHRLTAGAPPCTARAAPFMQPHSLDPPAVQPAVPLARRTACTSTTRLTTHSSSSGAMHCGFAAASRCAREPAPLASPRL